MSASLAILKEGLIFLCAVYIASTRAVPQQRWWTNSGNNQLSNLQQISTLPYNGCESIVCENGILYASSGEGMILKIVGVAIEVVARIGEFNGPTRVSPGRPLGVRYSPDRRSLIVADSNLGIFSVSLVDGTVQKLFPKDNNFRVTFFNDLDVLSDGTILVSESSTRYPVTQYLFSILSKTPTGRLLRVDPRTGQWSELASGFDFANGVQLHRDGRSVLVAEAATGSVYRVPLNGGPKSLFASSLPGTPDNIRMSPRGGYWVPVSNVDSQSIKAIRDQLPFDVDATGQIPELPILQQLQNTVSAALVRLDENGNIIEVLRDPSMRVQNVAEVCENSGVVYTSSYFLPYIGRLTL